MYYIASCILASPVFLQTSSGAINWGPGGTVHNLHFCCFFTMNLWLTLCKEVIYWWKDGRSLFRGCSYSAERFLSNRDFGKVSTLDVARCYKLMNPSKSWHRSKEAADKAWTQIVQTILLSSPLSLSFISFPAFILIFLFTFFLLCYFCVFYHFNFHPHKFLLQWQKGFPHGRAADCGWRLRLVNFFLA